LQLEQKLKYAWDFIVNRNDAVTLYDNTLPAFCAMWYIESNANLSANIVQGLWYDELSLASIPGMVIWDTTEYWTAYAIMLLIQVCYMKAPI
jgi:hypothetical protein